MLTKNILGFLILFFNAAGIGYLLYQGAKAIAGHFHPAPAAAAPVRIKKRPRIVNDHIIPDEDDLLKDMDLSDLDNLNLDDFE